MSDNKIKSELNEVPETTLWTLHNRAVEVMRPDGILKDPWCVEIYKSIDYDYERSFGKADPSHAIRSKLFDEQIQKFLKRNPQGLVIGLGEGLETQSLRCDNGRNRWVSVDLPKAIQFREKFIKPTDRFKHISKSALDYSWMDEVKDEEVFITAQGLFMYFPEEDVRKLLQRIDQKFSRYHLMFDTIPRWLSKMTLKGWRKTPYYTTPPMPWGINSDEVSKQMRAWLPSINSVKLVDYHFPRGVIKITVLVLKMIPLIKYKRPSMVLITKVGSS